MENSTNFGSKNWLCGKCANDPGKGCLSQYHKLQGETYWSTTQEAAKQRCKGIVDVLKNDGNVNIKDKYGVTPLGVTAYWCHCDVLEHLNHNYMWSGKEKFTSSIHWHTSCLSAEVFQEKKRKLAGRKGSGHVKALADDHVAVLFPAAQGCSLGCIALLLKEGGSGIVPGGAGLLPIHKVAYEGHHLGREYLIAATSQTLIQESGSSAVHSAVDSQNQCLEQVIENGLDVNTLLSEHISSNTYDDRRETALCRAASNNEILCTKILLKVGENPNKDPLNCVLLAVRADSHGIVKLLLSYGADVNC